MVEYSITCYYSCDRVHHYLLLQLWLSTPLPSVRPVHLLTQEHWQPSVMLFTASTRTKHWHNHQKSRSTQTQRTLILEGAFICIESPVFLRCENPVRSRILPMSPSVLQSPCPPQSLCDQVECCPSRILLATTHSWPSFLFPLTDYFLFPTNADNRNPEMPLLSKYFLLNTWNIPFVRIFSKKITKSFSDC